MTHERNRPGQVSEQDQPPHSAATDRLLGEAANAYFDRIARGEQPDVEEFAQQYPGIADLIRDTFPAVSLLDESVAAPLIGESPRPANVGRFSHPTRNWTGWYGRRV